jgi:hypothetical protein
VQQHATTAALLIAIVARILTEATRPCNMDSMHKRGHRERLHGGHQSVAVGCSTFTTALYHVYSQFDNKLL